MRMYLITFVPLKGKAFRALVQAEDVESAIERARGPAEAAGIDRGRQEETLQATNLGSWPTIILPSAPITISP